MYPYHQHQQQQAYTQPSQSRGFVPPPQNPRPPQQAPYPQAAHPKVPGYAQPYQGQPQYQRSPQHPQYYQQQPQQYAPQQRHAAPPTSYPPNQGFYPPAPQPQAYPSYWPSPSYPQQRPGPVVPPVRSNSQSPEKRGRPLPAPTAGAAPRLRSGSMPPTVASYAAQYQPQQHPHPPTSSFVARPAAPSFAPGQPAETQPHTPPQRVSPVHPHVPHNNPPGSTHAPVRPPESPSSKRPLPAPPGGGSMTPPVASIRAVASPAAGAPPAAVNPPPTAANAASPAQRRTLPFSPTQPPNADLAMSSRRGAVRPPQRSSTLPAPPISGGSAVNNQSASPKKEDVVQAEQRGSGLVNGTSTAHTQSPRSAAFAPRDTTAASSFALPPQQRHTQSLAFRIASLSLQDEQAKKWPASRPMRSAASPSHTAIDLDDAPPPSSIRRPVLKSKPVSNTPPRAHQPFVPKINLPGGDEGEDDEAPGLSISVTPAPSISISPTPAINISEAPSISVTEAPSITVSEATPTITVSHSPEIATSSLSSSIPEIIVADLEGTLDTSVSTPTQKRKGLVCHGCARGIVGRIVSAMGGRWHPACFKCTVCSELLEHVSSYEHAGKPYCHLDYHEKFAPQCYHCRTPIIDERFITLDDHALGKRTYHEQHFFCAECGDPFLAPTIPGTDKDKDKDTAPEAVMQEDDVGFTVYNGHPYCEACHVRLRYPKCKRCKKSIRDGMQAVEALGGKWCWECFLCAGCEKPFDDPAFFQRDNKPYCEACFSVIIKSEM